MVIMHCAGLQLSNVDLLTWLVQMPESILPAIEELDSMVTTSSQIKITDLWREHLPSTNTTTTLVITRAQAWILPKLDLSAELPQYSDLNREDDDHLNPPLPHGKEPGSSYLLSMKAVPSLYAAFRDAYTSDEEFGKIYCQVVPTRKTRRVCYGGTTL